MTTTNSSNGVGSSTAMPVIVPGCSPTSHSFPLTDAQAEVWLASKQGDEANCAFNEISTLCFRGSVNVDALKNAWVRLVSRHQSMRSRFSGDGTRMIVDSQQEIDWRFLDWSENGEQDNQRARLKLLQDEACIPFDLENGPLYRLSLQKMSDAEFYLTITAHHIVIDGWTMGLLACELGSLYDQENGVKTESLPTSPTYQEYSRKMEEFAKSENGKKDAEFWAKQFEDSVPVLDLPIEGERPPLRTYFARRHDQLIPASLVESVRKLGAKSGCSLFNTMLALFQAYVSRISGSNDFCVGIPTAGQLAMDCPGLFGHCVNMMPLRTEVDTSLTFEEQLKKTRSTVLDALEHERYTFGKVLANINLPRDPSRVPLMPISFNLDPVIDSDELGFDGLEVKIQAEPRMFENLEWFVNGIIQADKSVELQVQYNSDLFSAEKMKNLFDGFQYFIQQAIERPGEKLLDLSILTIDQQQKMLVAWNDTHRDFPLNSTLHDEISKQASKTPNDVAVKFEDVALTYSELDRKANQIARCLRTKGVATGDLVGICVPRDENMVVSVLGIMKSGAGYVPLDPAFPQDRLRYMCDHSQLKLVLSAEETQELVDSFDKPTLVFEQIESEFSVQDERPLDVDVAPEATAYVIYTSGSTGTPKGVDVPHGVVVNFLHSMAEQPGFGANDSVLAVTTLSFDIAVLELYLPLIVGGQTVIATKATTVDGPLLVDAVEKNSITVFQSTPGTLRLMIAAGWKGDQKLKVLCGGEPMPEDLVKPILERCGQFWNMYGPTETTVWSSLFQITDADAQILIGKPIANTQLYILDKNFQPVPVGGEGEIFIGGAGVTHGYLHQPEMTRERFVENPYFNPFVDYCNHRLYRTGDLGRFKPDGSIQFLRRNDKQVKVRGFRIELGEIETAIKSLEQIDQAVAIVREDNPGDERLVAYSVNKPGVEYSTDDLRNAIREVLPYYMVPQHFVGLEKLPQTNNGKIDYKSLPVPVAASNSDDQLKPETAVQRYVAEVWGEILEMDDININDNFFDLGGHSLLVMRVINSIEETTGARLSPPDFLVGTLEQIADKVDQNADVVVDELEPGEETGKPKTNEPEPVATANEAIAGKKSGGSLIGKIKGFWD